MDRKIEVKVNGHHLTKDNNVAGVQHESNATVLRITFDEGWDGYAKKVTFWDAYGRNPVLRTLTVDLMEDAAVSTRVYIVPIPGEAMTEAGEITFIIDGFVEGIRRRSVSDSLKVKPAKNGAEAVVPEEPTPSQAEQLQLQVEAIMDTIHESAASAASAAENAQIAAAAQASVEANATAAVEAAAVAKLAAESAKQIAGGNFATPAELNAHTENVSNPHSVTAKQVGAVAKTGDTMTGKLKIASASAGIQLTDTTNDTMAYVAHTNHVTDIGNNNASGSADNGRFLRLKDSANAADIKQAVQFVNKANGISTYYNLYGEHNKPTMDDLNGMGSLAVYYAATTAMSADDVLDSFALVPISSTVNPELSKLLSGSYAYLITLFYNAKTTTARRMQIAMSYNTTPQRMAVRSYGANGWIAWRGVSLDAPVITAGTTDLTEGVSTLATGAIHLVYE